MVWVIFLHSRKTLMIISTLLDIIYINVIRIFSQLLSIFLMRSERLTLIKNQNWTEVKSLLNLNSISRPLLFFKTYSTVTEIVSLCITDSLQFGIEKYLRLAYELKFLFIVFVLTFPNIFILEYLQHIFRIILGGPFKY